MDMPAIDARWTERSLDEAWHRPVARRRVDVMGSPIDSLAPADAVERILGWGAARESRTVCACNVHSIVQARRDARLQHAVAAADLAVADGAPVAWLMRRLGAKAQRRIAGPDLMSACLAAAAERGQSVFFYGSTEATLERLVSRLRERFPTLLIAGTHAPSFSAAGTTADEAVIEQINASGAGTVWVALGCPKQEAWIQAHRDRIDGVLLGVGAAFDFHAGVVRRAPAWMQRCGLEWLHRLASEPRRLARRYLVTNTTFIALLAPTLLAEAMRGVARRRRAAASASPANTDEPATRPAWTPIR